MAQFVQSVANQQIPPPYHFPNVTAHAFLIDVDMGAVQEYCDTYFNLGDAEERGFVYRPCAAAPYALLMVVEYPMMINSNRTVLGYGETPFSERGYASQNEVFLAVPVIRHGLTLQDLLTRAALEWFLPFVVVDNSTSAFSGREILGLEKLWGEITLGQGPFPDSFSVNVGLPGWPSLEPTAMQQMLPFLSVTTGGRLPAVGKTSDVASPWTLLQSRFAIGAMQTASAFVDNLCTTSSGIIPSPMRLVTLKQFRDATDPHRAIYQALVGTRSRYYDVANLALYNEHDVTLNLEMGGSFAEAAKLFVAGTPCATGDAKPVRASVPVRGAFTFNAHLDFDEMQTLHLFPVDGDDCDNCDPERAGMLSPWLAPWWGLFNAPTRPGDKA
jgi:hypothetical protein